MTLIFDPFSPFREHPDSRMILRFMNLSDDTLRPFGLDRLNRWRTLALLAWGITLLVFVIMFFAKPERVTGFAPYLRGAHNWLEGDAMYSFQPNKGFVYSPLIAVFFSSLTWVSVPVANILWRLMSAGILLVGIGSVLKIGPFSDVPKHLRGLVFLLILPIAAGNLDSGQANPIVVGLLMIGVAGACAGRWTIAAIAVAGAFYWKIYPITLGMLLVLVAPVKFGWRFVLALLVMGLLPFLFQNQDYVVRQYQQWVETRMVDNRLTYPIVIAPLDLWFLLVRIGHLPLSETGYHILRLAGGAAIAGFCLYGRWKAWPKERILAGLFSLACVWMLLLGPASESLTYLILVPAAAIGVVESFSFRMHSAARIAAVIGYGFLLLAILRVGFFSKWQDAWQLALQPVGALFFLAYCLMRYLDDTLWDGRKKPAFIAPIHPPDGG